MANVSITINDVRKGIMSKINSFKDEATEIYGEKIEQGFQEPCFYIKELRSGQTRELGNRYKRGHFYDIHYFPDPEEFSQNKEMLDMAEVLYDQMEFISVNGCLVMAQNTRHEITGGVLHFFVDYPMFVKKVVPYIDEMGTLQHEGGIKKDD